MFLALALTLSAPVADECPPPRVVGEFVELKNFAVPRDPTGHQLQPWVLPTGGVLLGHLGAGKVMELDREGKILWERAVLQPNFATRLPNGNVLVCSAATRKVTELDRSGKTVRELTGNMQPYKAERR